MTRLATIVLGIALLVAQPVAHADQMDRPARIGTLLSGSPKTHGHYLNWFREGLRDLGYVDGKNVVFISRWARGKSKRLAALAVELVEAKVDVMMVVGVPAVRAAQQASKRIPIVVGNVANIVQSGFVKSLAKPGGNVTGSTFDRDTLNGKRLGIFNEALPNARRVAFLFSPSRRGLRDLKRTKAASRTVGLKIEPLPVRSLEDIGGAFGSFARERPDGLLIPTSSLINFHRKRVSELAVENRLPTMCNQESYVRAGCLMSYTVNREPLMRRAAAFVDKILQGAKPAELPIEVSSRYKLVVNLKTAKALYITLPRSILLQANEIIE